MVFSSKIDKYYNAEFHSGWKLSPNKMYQVTVDGRGENASEEGVGVLVIKNNKTNETTVYDLANNGDKLLTPKVTEWIDDNHLYVIIGFSQGTVSKGGKLYEFNIKDNKLKPIVSDLKDTEEVISIMKNENGSYTFEKHIYDNEFMNGTTEKFTIKP